MHRGVGESVDVDVVEAAAELLGGADTVAGGVAGTAVAGDAVLDDGAGRAGGRLEGQLLEGVADADAAIAAARTAFPIWSNQPVEARARVLESAAKIMESRRLELNSLLILEAGKPWVEADGDVSESHTKGS